MGRRRAQRLAQGRPPNHAFLFTGTDGTGPWRDHDYRNWRSRHFDRAADAVGHPTARPYDLRHSFASLLLHEGRVSVVDLASQLGHAPTMTLNTYGHVIAELREGPRVSTQDQIDAASNAPKKTWRPNRKKKTQSRRGDSNPGPLHYE